MKITEKFDKGNSSIVVRVDNQVYRTAGIWTPTIHKLLNKLKEGGVTEVPEAFGINNEGQEVLSFIQGDVANYPLPEWLWSNTILHESFALMRRFHDAININDFKDGTWQSQTHQPMEVICHNDFAPYNIVFKNGHVIGLIDLDTASSGSRLWDFSYLAYRLIPFCEENNPQQFSMESRINRLEKAIESYGVNFNINEIFETMIIRLEDLARYTYNRSKETGNKDLANHASMYKRDAARIHKLEV